MEKGAGDVNALEGEGTRSFLRQTVLPNPLPKIAPSLSPAFSGFCSSANGSLPVLQSGIPALASREEKQLRDCRLLRSSASPSPNCRLSGPSF